LLLFAEDHHPHDSTAYRGVHQSPKPMGLFYTGEVLLGLRLGLAKRERLARVLGSSCHLFRLVAQRRSM
jgi:hypothetical protein